jgi:cell division septum initiation protein DivIVA
MSQLTTSQRQQQLTNILLVGNLYKSHQISNKLTEISDIQKKAIEVQNKVAKGIDRLSSQVEYQIAQKQAENNEIRKNKLLRDVFFQITEEIDEIKSIKTAFTHPNFIINYLNYMKNSYSSFQYLLKENEELKTKINNLEEHISKIYRYYIMIILLEIILFITKF